MTTNRPPWEGYPTPGPILETRITGFETGPAADERVPMWYEAYRFDPEARVRVSRKSLGQLPARDLVQLSLGGQIPAMDLVQLRRGTVRTAVSPYLWQLEDYRQVERATGLPIRYYYTEWSEALGAAMERTRREGYATGVEPTC